ncbi:MAG TPA: lysylphosphatidylglycerol synthase transmembrane domain-containing protein, partial [Candidatus Limnocylindrales bacterium]
MSREARVPEEGPGRGPVADPRGSAGSGRLGTAASGAWRNPVIRLITGLAISAAFLAVTVSRVDLGETARALGSAAPGGILLALVLGLVELTIRAQRWRVLLQPSAQVPLRSAFAYLTIGYFANLLLPARLGDVTRAYLAGRSFRISSLVTLGTVVVERVSDTATILVVVLVAGLAIAPGSQVAGWAEVLAVAAVIGVVGLVAVGVVTLRSGLLDRRLGR